MIREKGITNIYGTERDRVNCPFYYKIGACRHGEKCTRKHIKPTFSQTIAIPQIYRNPSHDINCKMTKEQISEHFDQFYEDIFVELAKYGIIEELHVCDNICDHLAGNVYVKFRYEDDALKACEDLNSRFYAGRPLWVELCPVTDFRESSCRKLDFGECNRAGLCNFMHLRYPTSNLRRDLYDAQRKSVRELGLDRSSKIPIRERIKY